MDLLRFHQTSILEHSTKTGGSIPRVLEFDNIVWTQSAKHAKSIKREIAKSYGHFGVDFVNRYQKVVRRRQRGTVQSM